jgi:hypothetical protein
MLIIFAHESKIGEPSKRSLSNPTVRNKIYNIVQSNTTIINILFIGLGQ